MLEVTPPHKRQPLAIVLGALSLFSAGGVVYADLVRPRPKEVKEQLVALPAGVKLPANVTLQIVDRGDAVRLVVNKAAVIEDSAPSVAPKTR